MNTNGKTITFLTILIAIVGVITPIVWDWWNSNSNLTLTHLETTKIIEKKVTIDGLEIFYHNKKVNNLSKTLFKLKNTGRLPIIESDIIDKIEISFPDSNILDASIEETVPSNINVNINIKKDKIQVSFKLLNSMDTIILGVLTDSIDKKNFSVKARIKNINELEVQKLEEQVLVVKDISWTVYVVGFFTLFFFIVTIKLISDIPKKKKQLVLIKNKLTPIHKGESVDIIRNYIDNEFGMTPIS